MKLLIFYSKDCLSCRSLISSIENFCFESSWDFEKCEVLSSVNKFMKYGVSTDSLPHVIIFDEVGTERFNKLFTTADFSILKELR